MKVHITAVLDSKTKNKLSILGQLSDKINSTIENANFESEIDFFYINFTISGLNDIELFKKKKSKFVKSKISKNRFTGENQVIKNSYFADVQIFGEDYANFVNLNSNDSLLFLLKMYLENFQGEEILYLQKINFDISKFKTIIQDILLSE
jgi:hypothetical protein